MYRSRTQNRKYSRYLARASKANEHPEESCDFCAINEGHQQLARQTTYFKIIRNLFPYSVWDRQRVADHLMIVPKPHVDELAKLPTEAAAEFVRLISEYEHTGYDIYARATAFVIRSVPHQHTHLIKGSGREHRTTLYLRKPYVRIAL